MDKCANCERTIGKLETPFVYNDQIVCSNCHKVLAEQIDNSMGSEIEAEVDNRTEFESTKHVASSWTPGAAVTKCVTRKQAPTWRRQVRILLWIGVALWFGPFFLLLPFLLGGVADDINRMSRDLQPTMWLGAVIAIGSMIALFVGPKSE